MKTKNKLNYFIVFICCIAIHVSLGQDYTRLKPIDEKNVHWSIINSEIERITKPDPNSPIGIRVDKFGLINTKDANSLFPGWNFYGLECSEYMRKVTDKKYSLALRLRYALAVSSGKAILIYNEIDYEKFLKLNKVSIRDVNEAKLVWKSWCEIKRQSGKDLKVEKAADNEWKLGINSYEQTISSDNEFRTVVKRTSFYKITTDPNTYQITKCKDEIETSDKRQEGKI